MNTNVKLTNGRLPNDVYNAGLKALAAEGINPGRALLPENFDAQEFELELEGSMLSENSKENLKTAKELVFRYLLNAKPSEVKESLLLLKEKFDLGRTENSILKDFYIEQKEEYDRKAKESKKESFDFERDLSPYYLTNEGVIQASMFGEKTIISGRTEIIGFSDNLDIDLNDTESNRFTHYKLRTGAITLYPEHGDLLTKAGIIKIIKAGMIAREADIKEIEEYFMLDIQRAKEECPQIKVCTKPGWKRNNTIFVSGNYAYGDSGAIEVHLTNPITGQMYKKKGTLEGWKIPELVEWLGYEEARFLFYVAFTCYIASFLGVQNIIISMIGETTGGKTLSASIAGSGMGRTAIKENGESIVRAANITQAAAEYLSVAINGHYVVFDDATPGKDYSGLIYMISNGRKKDRAPNSMLEGGEVYNAVYVITGEQGILSETVTQGANGRMIELGNSIEKSTENAERAKKIEDAIKDNYGHIAELFLKKVFERKGLIKEKYFDFCNKFRDEGKDIGGRLGDQMACICIAGEIVEEIFSEIGIPAKDPVKICENVIQYNSASEQKREYWLRGLEIVYGEIESWQRETDKEGNPTQNLKVNGNIGGSYTGNYLNILESTIREICERNHLNKKDLIEKWMEKGVTRADPSGKGNKTVKINGSPKKTISFDIIKVEKLLEYEKEKDAYSGVKNIDNAVFKSHVKNAFKAWYSKYERPPENNEDTEFCVMYYKAYPTDSGYYSIAQIMAEVASYYTEKGELKT